MAAHVHVGDVGTEIVLVIPDENGVAVNVSSATTLSMSFLSPAPGSTLETMTAVLDTTGLDGKIKYVTVVDDLDSPGTWQVQGYVVIGTTKFHADVGEFEVHPNLS